MTDLAALRREAVERAAQALGQRALDQLYGNEHRHPTPWAQAELVLDASGLLAHIERLEAVVEAAREFGKSAIAMPPSIARIVALQDALDNLDEHPVPEQS